MCWTIFFVFSVGLFFYSDNKTTSKTLLILIFVAPLVVIGRYGPAFTVFNQLQCLSLCNLLGQLADMQEPLSEFQNKYLVQNRTKNLYLMENFCKENSGKIRNTADHECSLIIASRQYTSLHYIIDCSFYVLFVLAGTVMWSKQWNFTCKFKCCQHTEEMTTWWQQPVARTSYR